MGARFSRPVQTGPGAHPASCTMGRGLSRCKERPGRDADPSPLLVPWSRKSTSIPLLPQWAVRPLQSLSACTRVHFFFPKCFTLLQTYLYQKDKRVLPGGSSMSVNVLFTKILSLSLSNLSPFPVFHSSLFSSCFPS